jgi:uncharacterized membrane protein YgcG
MKFRNQAFFAAVALAFVALGRASAQEQSTRPPTDSRRDAPAATAASGSAIDSARARAATHLVANLRRDSQPIGRQTRSSTVGRMTNRENDENQNPNV